jgi:ATP-dependent helicase/nuclease subunit B
VPEPHRDLRVVLGPPGAIEDGLIRKVAEIRQREALAPVDVLVGGVLMRPYLQRRMAAEVAGVINVRVVTLGELGIRLAGVALRRAGDEPLSAVEERACAAAAARACTGYFAPVAGMPGFADATRRLVRELREEGIAPPDLMAAAGEIESPAKAVDLAELYARYLERRAGHFDGLDGLAASDPEAFDGVELMVFGLWHLGAVARRLVAGIAERVPVTVYLPSVSGDADDAHRALREWLDGRGATTVRSDAPVAVTMPLDRLRDGLCAPGDAIDPDPTVRLVSAPDPPTEIRAVARQCLEWARDGIPFRDMAVVYRQAETYRPLAESVFAEAGIPVYLDEGPSVAHRPIGRRVLALVDLLDSRLSRRDVMAFLSDGDLPAAVGERVGAIDVLLWDEVSREAGVVEGVAQWRDRLSRVRGAAPWTASGRRWRAPEWRAGCDSLIAFIDGLAGVIADRPVAATWQAGVGYLSHAIAAYVDAADPVIAQLTALGELDAIAPPGDFRDVLDAVRAAVRSMRADDLDDVRQGAFGLRGVNVLDVNQMRHLRFRAVAIVGLAERSFPPPPRQDPLLLDGERRDLNTRRGWTLPLRARGADVEPLQFAVAVHGAGERLCLTSPRGDEAGGRSRLPSSFFAAAASAIEGRRVRVVDVDRALCVARLPAGRVGASDVGSSLTVAERDRTLIEIAPELGVAVMTTLAPRAGRATQMRNARWASSVLTRFDGVFDDPVARAAAAARAGRPMAVTGLERYATCPMQHFLSNVLRLEPLEEPAEILRINPLDRGSAVHEILERFVGSLTVRPTASEWDRLRDGLDQVAADVLAGYEADGRTGAPLLWDLDRDVILDDLHGWLAQEIADPVAMADRALEMPFGGGVGSGSPRAAQEPALELPAGGRRLRLRGRIDRLEFDADRFRVIDYKTGKGPTLGDGEFDGGKALQLPIYLLAGARLRGRDARTGEASYQVVSRHGRFRRIVFDGAVLAARRPEFDAVLGRIADGIAAGDFHAEPSADACRYCAFDGLCDAGRVGIRARKQGDPRIRTFGKMRGVE